MKNLSTFYLFRIAIERDSIALKSAVLTVVYFYIVIIVHNCQQAAKIKLLLNKNSLLEVFPLTIGSGKTIAFENRWSRYKELGKKVPQAYRVYVEDTFLPCDAGDARIFSKEHEHGLRVSKHIFVGNSRLVTAMTHADNHGDTTEQTEKRYYYHADHLQSAQFITNAKGEQYEHIEYTPYGELWIEETAPGIDKLPFRFTGKELDEETGLYYYGARYLDPKYSRWLSGDPALNDYIPKAPIDDEAKKHNENLPGMGGVFNVVNLHVYHYAGNNPIKYTDPDGRDVVMAGITVTVGAGTALSYETGIILSIDKQGNYQIGSYQISGGGFFAGLGVSAVASFSWAPFAQKINDMDGMTETIGSSYCFGLFTLGMDVNIPLEGSVWNFSISLHPAGIGSPKGPEGHGLVMTTTTKLYGEGISFSEAWNNALENGLLNNLPSDALEHFKKAYVEIYKEPLPLE